MSGGHDYGSSVRTLALANAERTVRAALVRGCSCGAGENTHGPDCTSALALFAWESVLANRDALRRDLLQVRQGYALARADGAL